MTLYEIDARLEVLLDFDDDYIDTTTGEVVGIEDVEALEMARSEKIEGWGLWIKNRTAEAAAIKEEEKRLKERREAIERKVEASTARYKDYLAGEKVNTPRLQVKYTKSESTEFTGDLESLPDIYKKTKTTVEPDKMAIKAALKAGIQIEGAALVPKINIKIS